VTFTDVDHKNYLILYCLIKLSFAAAVFFAFLIWLFHPIVLENPGIAAYQPPPGTRLVPLPRKIDALEITEVPPARNLAAAPQQETASGAIPAKKSSTRVAKLKPVRKIVPPSWYAERAFAYERGRPGYRGSADRHRFWF